MFRVQLALNVDDLEAAAFSGCSTPKAAKRKPGCANFAIADPPLKLVLLENPGTGQYPPTISVWKSARATPLHAILVKAEADSSPKEISTTCCFATGSRSWVGGGTREVYH